MNRPTPKRDKDRPGARRLVGRRDSARSGLMAVSVLAFLSVAAILLSGCTPAGYRRDADRKAYAIVDEARERTLGRT